jgi:glycosyltransferase involved in cell wall biosynthesis
MNSHSISAVLLVRNEEANIRWCLEGLRWCDEIVVVDMESDDNTVSIVREYTDRIYSHEIVVAFDSAKKFAIDKARNEWVLLVDADEMVPFELSVEIRNIVEKDEVDAVYFAFKNFILGEWNRAKVWWPNYHCRLFRKQVIDVSERVHAYFSVMDSARTKYLPAEEKFSFHHFAYRDTEQFIVKLNRYTSIEAKHMYDDGKKFSFYLLFKSTIKEFVDRYIRLRGYTDGVMGFFVSVLMAVYRTVACIKLWEMERNTERPPGNFDRLKKQIIDGYR